MDIKMNRTMKIQLIKSFFILTIFLTILSCDSKPKVIESNKAESELSNTPAFKNIPTANSNQKDSKEHKVTVKEALNTDKYTYLNVSENGEEFWIAVQKQEVEIGDIYYFRGGLMKKNFYSQEFDRVFETVYLVSEFWKQPTGVNGGSALDEAISKQKMDNTVDLEVGNIKPAEGSITIAELYKNKEKYNGKTIKVTGKCIKVNPMIMKRNWIHLKDNSSEDLDLTITTTENIPLGAVLTLEGTIALDRDFGAGYRYDIIMEGAVMR